MPCVMAVVGVFAPTSGLAGTFSIDFSSVPGGAALSGSAIIDSGRLLLTDSGGANGTMAIGDLDGGKALSGFSVSFKGLAAGSSGVAASDGFSFSFGDSSTLGTGFGYPKVLTQGVSVVVNDRWGGYYGGPTKLAIVANGSPLDSISFAPDQADDGVWHDLSVSYVAGSGSTASWTGASGTKMISLTDAVLTSAGFSVSGEETFSFNATSGGALGTHAIDDVSITTVAVPEPSVLIVKSFAV